MKKVQDNIRDKKAVVFPTDKSKRFYISTPEDYKEDMKVHVEKDNKVDDKYLNKVTKIFNDSSKSFVKILGIGKSTGQVTRAMSMCLPTVKFQS